MRRCLNPFPGWHMSILFGIWALLLLSEIGWAQSPSLVVNPTSLSFSGAVGSTAQAQNLSIASSGADQNFTAAASVTTPVGGSWLSVSPDSGTTPSNLTVTVDFGGLAEGSYNGMITITASGASNSPVTVPVSLTVQLTQIIIIKEVMNDNGGTLVAGDFSGTIAGVTAVGGNDWTGAASPGVVKTLTSVGSYNVSEYLVAGYSAAYSADCLGTIALGETKTCTVTNNDIPPFLRLVAEVINDDGGVAESSAFNLSAFGGAFGEISISGMGEATSDQTFSAGTYTLSVDVLAGYATTGGWDCGLIAIGDTIEMNLGQEATCTIVISDTPRDLFVDHSQLDFSAPVGGAADDQTIHVNSLAGINFAPTSIITSINPQDSWLSVNPTSGTTLLTLTVSVNPAGLAASPTPYVGVIQISVPSTANSIIVPITLTVSAPPVISPIANQTVQAGEAYIGSTPVLTQGTLSVTWSLVAGPSGMTISDNGVVSWPNPTDTGSPYTITIRASNSAGSDEESWLLTVFGTPPPVIELSPTALRFVTDTGGIPVQKTFLIKNVGGGTLVWTASVTTDSGGNWLSVSNIAGSAPATLFVTVSPTDLSQGTYTGKITIAASGATNSPQELSVTLAVGMPVINENGVVNGASFSSDGAEAVISSGSIASLFGLNLASDTAAATGLPLPRVLAGAQVLVNGTAVPLFYVSPTQINFQMPPGLSGSTAQVMVVADDVMGLEQTVRLAAESPGIFTINQQGSGQGAVLLANTDVIAAPNESISGGMTQPAERGEVISIFCTGLGATNPPMQEGQPAGTSPLSETITRPLVMIGGIPAEVLFSGLAPGFVGLYQVDVVVPAGVQPGSEVELTLSQNGVPSNTVTIAVQ